MKIVGLSCSARKNGNTANAIGIALNYLFSKGVETRLIHLTDYTIKPCGNCGIEYYYNKEARANLAIHGIMAAGNRFKTPVLNQC